MLKKSYEKLNEKVYTTDLENGLKVIVIPKKGYTKCAGIIATKFGSLYSNGIINYHNKKIVVKPGIAHFLEHRLFDNKKGQVFDLFSEIGAISNAFTTYDKTAYYFLTSDKIEENVNLLLDFVQELNITPQSVEKEKNIIVEELNMYEDNPESRAIKGILNCLYEYNPIRLDIGGSPSDVKCTSLLDLEVCHKTFYHPSNMILVIVGNVDPDSIEDTIKNNQNKKNFEKRFLYKDYDYYESNKVLENYKEIEMPISTMIVSLGYKFPEFDKSLGAVTKNKLIIAFSIYMNCIFSESSALNEKLYSKNVITSPIQFMHENKKKCNFSILLSEVLDYDKYQKEIEEAISSFDAQSNILAIERIKNLYVGISLKKLESPLDYAISYVDGYINNLDLMEEISLIKSISVEDIDYVGKQFKKASKATFVIKPQKEKKND
ncbi:MAG: pitrilysin family protein [Bacilli bacterium]|nr:pitrilysin family protein [Bacilli bacterium]